MNYYKRFDNGLRLVVQNLEGMLSVSAGVLVKTGSINEDEDNNGISHFIEHNLFKGTNKRSSFEISDYIDRIGAQINAFTSKELTCYYTKSTAEHLEDCIEVLSDIFFNSVFDKQEMEKEKGVIIEEINMSEDTPEDICLDVLAESYYGKTGLGRTILGTSKNIRKFNKEYIKDYMSKYYTADNVVIAIAGNIKPNEAEKLAEKYFASLFTNLKSVPQFNQTTHSVNNLYKFKKIEQAHLGLCMSGLKYGDKNTDALSIANTIFGGGMSSRLFQKIREELGLAYSVYSYASQYKNSGVVEIYAGVNSDKKDLAYEAIINEIKKFRKEGITEQEFIRGKEQLKSAFIFSRESTASQMLLYGKYLIFMDKEYDIDEKLKNLENVTIKDVQNIIEQIYQVDGISTSLVGKVRKPITN